MRLAPGRLECPLGGDGPRVVARGLPAPAGAALRASCGRHLSPLGSLDPGLISIVPSGHTAKLIWKNAMKQQPDKIDVRGLVITLLIIGFLLLLVLTIQPPRY